MIVNRLWHHHFGAGLIRTTNDFGHLGEKPTHPQLLDWLAGELIRKGWRLKPIHRLIVTSSTFRQASASDETRNAMTAMERDAENRLLWQFRPRRLEAEIIRDRMLHTAGALDLKMHGRSIFIGAYKKPVDDTPDRWRRSIGRRQGPPRDSVA